jgi:5-methylthioadenosine/S-adenosylhomocysteine deaminase
VSVAAHDLAIVDATVITMDSARAVHEGATILVDGDRITSVGSAPGPVQGAARTIDARGAPVLPGLVNAHAHLAMTLFRGLADDLDLARFLARMLPVEDEVL